MSVLRSVLLLFATMSWMAYGDSTQENQPLNSIKIMSYNLENLFDEFHDEGKKDFTFTPKNTPGKAEYCKTVSNYRYKKECKVSWTRTRVRDKLRRLARVVKNGTRSIPDLLVVSEIENRRIAERFNEKLGYDDILITDSPDTRGIDVGIFYKESKNLKYLSKREIRLDMKQLKDETGINYKATRNVMEGKFLLYGTYVVYIYAVHLPSQAAPPIVRAAVAKQIQQKMLERKKSDHTAHFVVAGDFNTISSDDPHAIQDVFQNSKFKLDDVHKAFQKDRRIPSILKRSIPMGTYFFPPRMQWNILDRFLVSDNLGVRKKLNCKKGLILDTSTYKIQADSFYVQSFKYASAVDGGNGPQAGSEIKGVPAKFVVLPTGEEKDLGYSDHFPIVAEFKIAPKPTRSKTKCTGNDKYFYR